MALARKLFIALVFLQGLGYMPNLDAAHIVGGEMYYECISPGQYQVTLKLYRDCNSGGAQFDDPGIIYFFKSDGTLERQLFATPQISFIPPDLSNPCLVAPPNVCVQEAIYEVMVSLPQSPGGYNIVYQRCCRNATIINLFNPGAQGATYMQHMPNPASISCNNSPYFINFPPIVICANEPLVFDHSAIDPDGDSLVYKLCAPYVGGSQNDPLPTPASPPPYATVQYVNPYTANFPMLAAPPLSIDPQTGLLTGKPSGPAGSQYVVGVCVEEYRNGNLIAIHSRDFQFNLANCNPLVEAHVFPPGSANDSIYRTCDLTITFPNNSLGAFSYKWDFGDPTTTNDNSMATTPTYTYPDTGTYVLTLIAIRGTQCTDTTQLIVEIYSPLDPHFSWIPQCPGIPMQFFDSSQTSEGTIIQWKWDFGDGGSSQLQHPQHTFTGNGPYTVTLEVTTDEGCSRTYSELVYPYPKPVISWTNNFPCLNKTINFNNTTSIPAGNIVKWMWNFGDGSGTSTQKNPTYTYNSAGFYQVKLVAISDKGCRDSLTKTIQIKNPPVAVVSPDTTICKGESVQLHASGSLFYSWSPSTGLSGTTIANPIASPLDTTTYTVVVYDQCYSDTAYITVNVNPTPDVNFGYISACPYDPILFSDSSSTSAGVLTDWIWDFGHNGDTSHQQHPQYTYNAAGPFQVSLIVYNSVGCASTMIKTVTPFSKPVADFGRTTPCLNVSLKFNDLSTVNSGQITDWLWDFGDNSTSSSLQNPGHTYTDTGSYLVSLIVTSNKGCRDTIQRTIVISPPVVAEAEGDTSICPSNGALLTAAGGINYLWHPGISLSDSTAAQTIASPDSTTIYTVIVSDTCFADTTTVTVVVFPTPDIDVYPDTIIYSGEEAYLFSSSHSVITQYLWSPSNSIAFGSSASDPDITVMPNMPTVYTLHIVDENGCPNEATAFVDILTSAIWIPNAFSPNGDGINDEFFILHRGLVNIDFFRIYNRWGQLLFEGNEVGAGNGWDGTFKGEIQPLGVYTYVITVPSGAFQKGRTYSGNVTLMR